MNILFFGPNGSGKGTQGSIIKNKFGIPHIESGAIFRENIRGGTDLGRQAKAYIDKGDLVPDEITIPMIQVRLTKQDCEKGWLLDGFPRNRIQAEKLNESLIEHGSNVDIIVEILLDRRIARERIMGRRLCANDNNHPNNVFIEAIQPIAGKCRVCGGELSSRTDDGDKDAIDKRHNIYYDEKSGTLAAAYYFKGQKGIKYINLDGSRGVEEVSEELRDKLNLSAELQ